MQNYKKRFVMLKVKIIQHRLKQQNLIESLEWLKRDCGVNSTHYAVTHTFSFIICPASKISKIKYYGREANPFNRTYTVNSNKTYRSVKPHRLLSMGSFPIQIGQTKIFILSYISPLLNTILLSLGFSPSIRIKDK